MQYAPDLNYRAAMRDVGWDVDHPPLSFKLDGRHSDTLLPGWWRSESSAPAPGGIQRVFRFVEPTSRLTMAVCVREFTDFPAWDWVVEFANDGQSDTPVIEDVFPFDVTFPMSPSERYFLHFAKGSSCRLDDFLPVTEELSTGKNPVRTLASIGGRSSDGVLPFMNVQMGLLPGRGFVMAVGWTGQWQAVFARGERGRDPMRVSAGMQHTRLRLRPGERIRTPRILVVNWQGDDPIIGNNLLRQLLLAHYVPRHDGAIVMPPIAHNTMMTYVTTGIMTEENQIETIRREAELGIEAHWIDACWYGSGGTWPLELGNWRVRRDRFPRGLAPVSEAAHGAGMKFILWFEPERVHRDSLLAQAHPEWLLRSDDYPEFHLVNLGLPEARAYLTDLVSKLIAEYGVDIYRQDFNRPPLSFWRPADAPEREGMTEIRYIEGLYAFWDELRARHPGLAIDNCAAGGRRIDLETITRSFPLWRSDKSDGQPAGKEHQVGDQTHTAGLSRWVPLHTGPVWHFTHYDFLSALGAGIVPYANILEPEFPIATARRALALLKELRPIILGDFHPLIPLTAEYHDWCAYQYHRPVAGDGFAVFLRRHKSPYPILQATLRAVQPDATYDVTLARDFESAEQKRMEGRELTSLEVVIPDKAGSLLLRYRKILR